MARFITRVELHEGSEGDYAILDDAMEEQGFSREIKSGAGIVYQLPTATYYWDTDKERKAVLEAAKGAAVKTNKRFGVIVIESQVSTWDGLAVTGQQKTAPDAA